MKRLLLSGTLVFGLGTGCGVSEEDVAALQSILNNLELDDCVEAEDEGYVDEEDEEAALAECIAAIQEQYDVNGDGQLTDSEIEESNTYVEELQKAKEEEWTEMGLSKEEGKAKAKEKRQKMRKIAKVACDSEFGNGDGTTSAEELATCKQKGKERRKEIRKDIRCQADTEECGPLSAAKIREVRKSKREARDAILTEVDTDGDGVISDEEKAAGGPKLKDKRQAKATERSGRVAQNNERASQGREARRERGRANRG